MQIALIKSFRAHKIIDSGAQVFTVEISITGSHEFEFPPIQKNLVSSTF